MVFRKSRLIIKGFIFTLLKQSLLMLMPQKYLKIGRNEELKCQKLLTKALHHHEFHFL